MSRVLDAPWIRETERRGTDYMNEWCFGYSTEAGSNYDPDYCFDEIDTEDDEY